MSLNLAKKQLWFKLFSFNAILNNSHLLICHSIKLGIIYYILILKNNLLFIFIILSDSAYKFKKNQVIIIIQ